ncbi:hypothetical protein ACFFLM_21300 [Deinococcus oregonensis]|uniref:Uncharacterized protein n=1 Tax=Deinococcus oregonensis TaxID=1805970 RepID=A0ABV6B417_9DEIO
MTQEKGAFLSTVVVITAVVIALLLSVKTYTGGGGLDGGWLALLSLVFGTALGVHNVNAFRKDKADEKKADEKAAAAAAAEEATTNETQ